jgi:tetratricopeptide (TPR) repeat protein
MASAIATVSAAAGDRETCSELGDEAIAACGRLINRNPGDAVAYANRGSAYRGKHDYDRAIADLDQAIRLDPKFAYAYNGRGNAYCRKGQYGRAIADYDQAIQLDPT